MYRYIFIHVLCLSIYMSRKWQWIFKSFIWMIRNISEYLRYGLEKKLVYSYKEYIEMWHELEYLCLKKGKREKKQNYFILTTFLLFMTFLGSSYKIYRKENSMTIKIVLRSSYTSFFSLLTHLLPFAVGQRNKFYLFWYGTFCYKCLCDWLSRSKFI